MTGEKPKPKPSIVERPHFARAMRIAHEHILHARSHPADLAELAKRLKMSKGAALAFVIAEQVTEEFELTERED
jgi:hypothetical protein